MPSVTFQGIGSGIDGAGIAKVVRDQYALQNIPRENQIKQIESENSSLEQLKTLLLDVADKLESLRTSNGGSVAKVADSSNTDVLTASADSTATNGTFDVIVNSLASNANGSFNGSFSSGSDFIISDAADAGSVNFTVGTGNDEKSFSVNVDESTTGQGFVDSFNEQASGDAKAQLINLGTEEAPDYRISFSTTEQGEDKGSISISATNDGLLSESGLGSTTIDQASNAEFTVSGIAGTFERSSNSISDAISGVSFQLEATGSATVNVQQSASAAADQVEAFIGSFNNLVEFINKEDVVTTNKVDGENVNVLGSLSQTTLDDNAVTSLRNALSSASSNDGTVTFASLGVATERDGTLSFDRDAFETAFNSNPEKVSEAITSLADNIAGVEGVVSQFTGYGKSIDQEIQSNEGQITDIGNAIERVERTAASKEENILKQFSNIEGLIAKLNADSTFITSLLQF